MEEQLCSLPGIMEGAKSSRQRCPRAECFLSALNNMASKGGKGIQTTLNYRCKTKKFGVMFIETSHIFLSILSSMLITQMIKN